LIPASRANCSGVQPIGWKPAFYDGSRISGN